VDGKASFYPRVPVSWLGLNASPERAGQKPVVLIETTGRSILRDDPDADLPNESSTNIELAEQFPNALPWAGRDEVRSKCFLHGTIGSALGFN
jgi:hypothetical protein